MIIYFSTTEFPFQQPEIKNRIRPSTLLLFVWVLCAFLWVLVMPCCLCWSGWQLCMCVSVCPRICVSVITHSAFLPWDTATANSHPSGFQLPQTRNMCFAGEEGGTILQLTENDTVSWDQQNCDNLPTKMYFSITVFHTLKEKAVSFFGFFLKAEVFSLAFNIGPTLLSEKKISLEQYWQYFN